MLRSVECSDVEKKEVFGAYILALGRGKPIENGDSGSCAFKNSLIEQLKSIRNFYHKCAPYIVSKVRLISSYFKYRFCCFENVYYIMEFKGGWWDLLCENRPPPP